MRTKLVLLGIIVLAFILRFYKLSEIPPGMHRDEVSTGYNAYLILQTGKDEHEQFLPLVFKAFGDWKRPINIYLTTLSISIFGLNEFAVRIPIVIIGLLTIVLVFFLSKELFNVQIALLSAFVLSISPWHIFMSRTGLGWNAVGLFLTLLGIYFFIKKNRDIHDVILSLTAFGISLFSYASNQILTLLLLPFLLIFDLGNIKKSKRLFAVPLIIFSIFLLVFLKIYLPVFQKNAVGTSFVDTLFIHENINIPRSQYTHLLTGVLMHNKFLAFINQAIQNYLKILSPQFFFYNQENNPAYSLLNFGNFYIFELPFMILGWVFLFRKKQKFIFLAVWLGLSIIPAALTKNPYSSTRLLNMLPVIAIVTAYGMHQVYEYLKKRGTVILKTYLLILIGLYTLSSTFFADEYFIQFPINKASHWGVAQKELITFLQENENNYSQIIISHPEESFYIYLVFYNKLSAKNFWQNVERYPETKDGFFHVSKIGKYQFRQISYPADFKISGRLLVDKTTDATEWLKNGVYTLDDKITINVKVLKQIKYPDGLPAYTILETSLYKL